MIISFFDMLYLRLVRRYRGTVPSVLEFGRRTGKRSHYGARWTAQRMIGTVVGGAWVSILAWSRVLAAGRDETSPFGSLMMLLLVVAMVASVWRIMDRYESPTDRAVKRRVVRAIGRRRMSGVWCVGWSLYGINLGAGIAAIIYMTS